eukprot:ctg_325.g85
MPVTSTKKHGKAASGPSPAGSEEKLTRVAIVSADRCRPRKCALEDAHLHHRAHIRGAVYRLRHLRAQVSVRRDTDHQLADRSGGADHPSVRSERVQAAPPADAAAGTGARAGGRQRTGQVDGAESVGGEDQAQPGTIQRATGLAGDSALLSRQRAAELL